MVAPIAGSHHVVAAAPAAAGPLEPGGRVGGHNMVVFGRDADTAMMSHLPMFHAPHDMQAVFKVRLPPAAAARVGDGLFTFQPEQFSLNDMLLGRLTTMRGTLYRGNLEAGGVPIKHGVEVKVEGTVLSHPLAEKTPASGQLEYRVVGSKDQAFVVHDIRSPPDFDQIAALDLSKSSLTETELAAGVTLTFPERPNDLSGRLAPGAVEAVVQGSGRRVNIAVARVISELVGPDFDHAP